MPRQFDPVKAIKILALVLSSPSAGERASARHVLIRMLDAYSIAGRDLLPRHYLDRGAVVEQVNDLLHPLWTGDDDAARDQRRAFVERRLIRWRLSWSDLIERLRSGSSNAAAWHWDVARAACWDSNCNGRAALPEVAEVILPRGESG